MILKTIKENFKILVRTILIILSLYLIIKVLNTFINCDNPKYHTLDWFGKFWYCIVHSFDNSFEHMDVWGYVIASLTFVVSILIAGSFDKEAKEKLERIEIDINKSIEELKNTNKVIEKSTTNLEDATRKIIETFPGILDKSIEIVGKVKGPSDRLLIMNYTSKLGIIHSFNRRFVNQIKDQSDNISFDIKEEQEKNAYFVNKVNLFKAKIEKLDLLIYEASRKINTFDLITFEDEAFKKKFIEGYLSSENGPTDDNLFNYQYDGKKELKPSDLSILKSRDLSLIYNTVNEHHHKAILQLKNYNPDCVTKREDIPYQMLLAEYYDKDNGQSFESIIMYAVDELNDPQNTNSEKKRNIIAISSRNKQMFKAFETLFNDVKNIKSQ